MTMQPSIPESSGAKGDGQADDTSALQEWLNALPGSGNYGRIPSKTYLTGKLMVPDGAHIRGDPGATLRAKSSADALLQVGPETGDAPTENIIQNLRLDGNSNQAAIGLQCRNLRNGKLADIKVVGAGIGIKTDTDETDNQTDTYRNEFYGLTAEFCGTGLYFRGEKNSRFDNLYAHNCTNDGIVLQAFAHPDLSELTQCIVGTAISDGNGGNGFVLDGVAKLNLGTITSIHNGDAGVRFKWTVERDGNSAIIGNYVSRRNVGGALVNDPTAHVGALQVGSMIAWGHGPEPDMRGILLHGVQSAQFGNVQITGMTGTAIELKPATINSAIQHCNGVRFSSAVLISNGGGMVVDPGSINVSTGWLLEK